MKFEVKFPDITNMIEVIKRTFPMVGTRSIETGKVTNYFGFGIQTCHKSMAIFVSKTDM